MNSFSTFWPWWLGALALAFIAVGYVRLLHQPLGFSGILARILDWRRQRLFERQVVEMEADQEVLLAAMLAATREEFGATSAPATITEPASCPAAHNDAPVRQSVSSRLIFVLMLMMGGLIAAVIGNRWGFDPRFDTDFVQVVGSGWWGGAVLLVGSILVGFGTQMAGGCTSGHGISGCARLQAGSLVATACFFGTAIAVSILLAWLAR